MIVPDADSACAIAGFFDEQRVGQMGGLVGPNACGPSWAMLKG